MNIALSEQEVWVMQVAIRSKLDEIDRLSDDPRLAGRSSDEDERMVRELRGLSAKLGQAVLVERGD